MIRACIDVAPPVPLEEVARVAREETAENAPVVLPGTPLGNTRQDMRESAVIVTGKKWQVGRVLKVSFVGGDGRVIDRVKAHAEEWTKYANIGFDFSGEDGEIRVDFDRNGGSWSYIGTDCLTIPSDEPTMNYGWLEPDTRDDEYARVVLHEFGHALGMPHEHQHPRAGIPWDKQKVYAYYMGPPNNWTREQVDQNLFARYSESETQFTEFDPRSIMEYPVPNELTLGDFQIGWNTGLSETDKKFISAQYPQESTKPLEKPGPATITLTRLLKRGVAEETNVTRDAEPWITARPWDGG